MDNLWGDHWSRKLRRAWRRWQHLRHRAYRNGASRREVWA